MTIVIASDDVEIFLSQGTATSVKEERSGVLRVVLDRFRWTRAKGVEKARVDLRTLLLPEALFFDAVAERYTYDPFEAAVMYVREKFSGPHLGCNIVCNVYFK